MERKAIFFTTVTGAMAVVPDNQWTYVETQILGPAGAVSAFVDVGSFSENREAYSAGKHYWDDVSFEVVPEPTSVLLLGLGGIFLQRQYKNS